MYPKDVVPPCKVARKYNIFAVQIDIYCSMKNVSLISNAALILLLLSCSGTRYLETTRMGEAALHEKEYHRNKSQNMARFMHLPEIQLLHWNSMTNHWIILRKPGNWTMQVS